MSTCCEVVRHLWALVSHHAGHKPKVTGESLASLTLYPAAKRSVRKQDKP